MADASVAAACPSTLKSGESKAEIQSPAQRGLGRVIFSLETPPLEEEPPHSPDSCFLCKRPLRRFFDVFMYRGDKPFCSEDCRQEQMDLDEAREREARYRRRRQPRRAAAGEETPQSVDVPSLRPALAAEAIVAG